MIGEIFEFFAGSVANGVVADAEQKRLAGIARAEGKVAGVLRVREGEATGLSRGWRGREVRPLPGAITYEFNRLVVDAVRRRAEPLSGREGLTVPMGTFEVLEVRTTTALLEWAMLPEDVDSTLERIDRPWELDPTES